MVAVTDESLEAVLAPLMLISRGQLQIVRLVVAIAVVCITGGVAVLLAIIFRGLITLIVSVVTLGREHQVCLPALDRLRGDISSQTGGLRLILTSVLLEDTHGIVVVVDTEVLVVVAVLSVDGLSGVTHQGLTIDHLACCIHGTILVPALQDVELQLQHVVEHPVRETTIEVHLLTIGLDKYTLLVAIGEVCIIRSALITSADVHVVVVGQGCTRHGIKPVGVVAAIRVVGLTGTDIAAVHHVEFLAE